MENASKALIIAGAILLSILLISLGIMVYNNAKGTVNEANLDSEATQTFNSKFTQYTGSNKSASDVNALVSAVNANNAANGTTRIKITLTGLTANTHYTGAGTAPTKTSAGSYTYVFSNAYRYKVTYTTLTKLDNNSLTKVGYIDSITIQVQ